jgi:hypothetical protein
MLTQTATLYEAVYVCAYGVVREEVLLGIHSHNVITIG